MAGSSADTNPEIWREYSNLQHVKHALIEKYLEGWFPKLALGPSGSRRIPLVGPIPDLDLRGIHWVIDLILLGSSLLVSRSALVNLTFIRPIRHRINIP